MNLIKRAKKLLGIEDRKSTQTPAAQSTIPQEWLNAAQAQVGSLLTRDEVEMARKDEQAHAVDTTALREAMLNQLDGEQIVSLALAIGLAPSQLFGGKGRKVMGLLQHAERNGRVTDLLEACQTLLPDVDWQNEHNNIES